MKLAVYCRVGKESLLEEEKEIEKCKKLAKKEGIPEVKLYLDEDISSRTPFLLRPMAKRLLDDIKIDKEISEVIINDCGRLARWKVN